MARYRIIRRGSCVQAGMQIFVVEEKCWFWWEPRGIFKSFADAELRVSDLMAFDPIKTEVVKEYE